MTARASQIDAQQIANIRTGPNISGSHPEIVSVVPSGQKSSKSSNSKSRKNQEDRDRLNIHDISEVIAGAKPVVKIKDTSAASNIEGKGQGRPPRRSEDDAQHAKAMTDGEERRNRINVVKQVHHTSDELVSAMMDAALQGVGNALLHVNGEESDSRMARLHNLGVHKDVIGDYLSSQLSGEGGDGGAALAIDALFNALESSIPLTTEAPSATTAISASASAHFVSQKTLRPAPHNLQLHPGSQDVTQSGVREIGASGGQESKGSMDDHSRRSSSFDGDESERLDDDDHAPQGGGMGRREAAVMREALAVMERKVAALHVASQAAVARIDKVGSD